MSTDPQPTGELTAESPGRHSPRRQTVVNGQAIADADRPVPHDLDAERALLGAILVDDGQLDALNLTPAEFWRDPHRRIYTAMLALRADGQPIDLITLRIALGAELKDVGGPAYIAALVDGMPRAANAPAYAGRVRECAAARHAIAACTRAAALLREDPRALTNGLCGKLVAAVEEARDRVLTAADGMSETLAVLLANVAAQPRRDWLVTDLIQRRELELWHGPARVLKTWLTLDVALGVAFGAAVADRFAVPEARAVLVVSEEDAPETYAERFGLLLRGRGLTTIPGQLHLIVGQGASLDDAAWRQRLGAEIRSREIAMLILDPLRSLTAGTDQGPREIRDVALYLRALMRETGVSIVAAHHQTKPQPGVIDTRRRSERASGGGLFAAVDGTVSFEEIERGRQSLCVPDGHKLRPDPAPFTLRLTVAEGQARLTAEATTGDSPDLIALHVRVLDELRQSGGGSTRALTKRLGRRREDVMAALDALQARGLVDSAEGPRKAILWCAR